MGKTHRRQKWEEHLYEVPVYYEKVFTAQYDDENVTTTAIEDEEGFRCTHGVNKARRWETMRGALEAHSVQVKTRKDARTNAATYTVPRTGEETAHCSDQARTKILYCLTGTDDAGRVTYSALYRLQYRPPVLTDGYQCVKYARYTSHNRQLTRRPTVRTGEPWSFARGDTLDVDMGCEKRVRVVSTQGSALYINRYVVRDASSLMTESESLHSERSYVHTYRLWYRSRAVRKWTEVGVFEGNDGVGLERAHRIDITARHLRFEPLGWDCLYEGKWTSNPPRGKMRVGIYVDGPPDVHDAVQYTLYSNRLKCERVPDGYDKIKTLRRTTINNHGGKAVVRPPRGIAGLKYSDVGEIR